MYASATTTRPTIGTPLPPGVTRGLTALGLVHFRDEYFPLDHLHGRIRLEAALDLHPNLVGRLGEGLDQGMLREAAYLDIETGGSDEAGAYAFLVGIGTFESFAFRVRQYFLASPAGEAAMLAAVSETM